MNTLSIVVLFILKIQVYQFNLFPIDADHIYSTNFDYIFFFFFLNIGLRCTRQTERKTKKKRNRIFDSIIIIYRKTKPVCT
jgi:hypothetical protein